MGFLEEAVINKITTVEHYYVPGTVLFSTEGFLLTHPFYG